MGPIRGDSEEKLDVTMAQQHPTVFQVTLSQCAEGGRLADSKGTPTGLLHDKKFALQYFLES